MGCDGGSIPKRAEMVKTKGKEKNLDTKEKNEAFWFNCYLSKEPLQIPVVSCSKGRLYNKEAVIQFLLDKSQYAEGSLICKHIKSLKDVTTLKLTPNPLYKPETVKKYDAGIPDSTSRKYICPITRKEMNGNTKFSYFKPCGCVVSDLALREIPNVSSCALCNAAFTEIVKINEVKKSSGDGQLKRKAEPTVSSEATKKRLDEILPDLKQKLAKSRASQVLVSLNKDLDKKSGQYIGASFTRLM